jgi:hypothetical protein
MRNATYKLAIAAVFCSCATQSRREEPILPFHVALVPIRSAMLADKSVPPSADDGLRLAVDPMTLSSQLRSALEERCFARVTLLALPPGTASTDFDAWPAQVRDAYWATAGSSVGADLILEGELRAAPGLHGGTNEKFWLNLPLFLAGGPFCYFIGDNSYRGEARLDAWLCDLRPIATSRATLSDGRAEVAHVQARFRGADLNFIDRAGGNVGSYALSIVVPAGFLARNSEHVEQSVAETATMELAQGLSHELRAESEHVLAGERVSSFHVAPESRLTRENGTLRFMGSVLLHVGEIQRMDSWRLETAGSVTSGDFDAGMIDPDLTDGRHVYLRYELTIRLPCSNLAQEARLTLVGGGRNSISRTFTFEVGDVAEPSPAVAAAR